MDTDDYKAAYEGRTGADRMALKLPIITDATRGDMDEVKRLRGALEYIASDVFCFTLERAVEMAKHALKPSASDRLPNAKLRHGGENQNV